MLRDAGHDGSLLTSGREQIAISKLLEQKKLGEMEHDDDKSGIFWINNVGRDWLGIPRVCIICRDACAPGCEFCARCWDEDSSD